MKKKKDNNDACKDGSCAIGPANGGENGSEEYADELLKELTGEETDEPKIVPLKELVPKKLFIRDRCLQLGFMIGPETKKQGKKEYEVGGFFLVKEGDDTFAFQDFIVPNGLEVTTGSITIDGNYDDTAREVREANKANKTKLKLGAMFHIHPHATGGLYHSKDDDDSLKNLANKMAKTTKSIHESRYALIEEKIQKEYGPEGICLKGDALSDAVEKFLYPDDKLFFDVLQKFGINPDPKNFRKSEFLAGLLDTIDHQTYEPRIVNFAVSFVFNNNGNMPFVKMGMHERFVFSGRENYETVSYVPIEIIDAGIKIPSAEEVEKIVKERVKFTATVYYSARGYWDDIRKKWVYYDDYYGYSGYYDDTGKKTGGAVASAANTVKTVAERILGLAPKKSIDDKADAKIGAESTKAKPKKAKPVLPANQVEKTSEKTYYYGEIGRMFVLALHSYVTDYRHRDCRYSTYVATLLDKLSEWRSTPRGNQKSDNGLESCILKTGVLLEDNPDVVEMHKTYFSRINDMANNVADELYDTKNKKEEIDLMFRFIAGDTVERSKLLEEYVPKVLEKKKMEKAITVKEVIELVSEQK